jgi:hypothetical protein
MELTRFIVAWIKISGGAILQLMERLKKVVTVIPSGHWQDSAKENLRYWITRPPSERVAAGRELRLSTYRRLHGRSLPRIKNVVRVIKPAH